QCPAVERRGLTWFLIEVPARQVQLPGDLRDAPKEGECLLAPSVVELRVPAQTLLHILLQGELLIQGFDQPTGLPFRLALDPGAGLAPHGLNVPVPGPAWASQGDVSAVESGPCLVRLPQPVVGQREERQVQGDPTVVLAVESFGLLEGLQSLLILRQPVL